MSRLIDQGPSEIGKPMKGDLKADEHQQPLTLRHCH